MLKRVGRISKKTIKVMIRTVETVVAFLIVVGSLAFWRLYTEPVEMKDMLPDLAARIIPAESGLSIQADSVVLSAEVREDGIVHISIRNLTMRRGDGVVAVRLPDVEMSYGVWHILTLNYMPDNLSITNPFLRMIIEQNGRLYIRNADEEETTVVPDTEKPKNLKERQLAAVDSFMRYILSFDALALKDARVVIDDRQKGQKLSIPNLDIALERQFGFNHAMKASAVLLVDKDLMNVTAEAQLNRVSRHMSFDIGFDDVALKKLGRVIPILAEADLTARGQIKGLFDFSRDRRDILACLDEGTFQVKVDKAGKLVLPSPLTNVYPVQSATINGAIGKAVSQIKIARSQVILTGGPAADLTVDVTGLDAYWKTDDITQVKTVLKAGISALPIEQVPAVWPPALGPDAHAWVKANLTEGEATKADFTLYFTGGELVDLFGEIPVQGVRVRYLDDMTPVERVGGMVYLYPDKVIINADQGVVGDLQLIKADVNLTELDKDVSRAHIVLSARGPVQDALRLISMKPLEFPQMFGLNPDQTGGYADVAVDLKFPLIDSLDTNQVVADVSADIVDGVFGTPVSGMTLKNGKLNLNVTNKRLLLSGTGSIGGLPLTLKWTEFFDAAGENAIQSQYDITGTVTDEQAALFYPDAKAYFTGTITGAAQLEKRTDGRISGQVTADLTPADLRLIPVDIIKPAHVAAAATVTMDITDGGAVGNVGFNLTGSTDTREPIQMKGSADWGNKGYHLILNELKGPDTDVAGEVELDRQHRFTLKIKGKALNLSGLYAMPSTPDVSSDESDSGSIPNVQQTPPAVVLDVEVDKLTFKKGKPFRSVRIQGERVGYFWQNLSADAQGSVLFSLIFNPENRSIKAGTTDLGDFLERLGVSERVKGGTLSLTASQPAAGGFTGTLNAADFALKDPGFLVQALTILGIMDAFRGKELVFKKAEIPFELTPHLTLYLKDGYAYGTTLGVTFKGRIRPDVLDLVGSVIPAYAINSLPGKIPLIGRLFTDGAGGGLMGVKYEVKGSPANPVVDFNALGSIAPGIFGNLFQ